ncbi:Internal alternative NAD(P)H-ubiquinone oxidoreductase A1 [Raphanus sativus]|nr:Internal alternative NAD(P)H-ubiquinone oxidoreductase A1 [Raphanus sativus]
MTTTSHRPTADTTTWWEAWWRSERNQKNHVLDQEPRKDLSDNFFCRNLFRNHESYNLSSRFCTALQHQHQQQSETIQATEVVNGFEKQQQHRYEGLAPTKEGEKPRLLVLGSGWAGCRLMKGIDTSIYDVVCVSPRNHMVFTPLLASTCVGTLEFRSVAEPISRIQPAISREPGSYYFLANCSRLDSQNHEVHCETRHPFGINGVLENAIFLREVHHAQEIRRKLLLNLMLSEVPGLGVEEKKRLLHCVVVGGGPTGVEFSVS